MSQDDIYDILMEKMGGAPDVDPYQKEVDRQRLFLRARKEAKRLEDAELFTPPPFSYSLEEEFEIEDPEIEWTIEGLHKVGGNTIIIAGFKTGKTTLMLNLAKALADGEPFLGKHKVRTLEGRIAYLNFEVEAVQMKRELRSIKIANPKRIAHIPLRGQRFDVIDEVTYNWAVAEMRRLEIEALVVDPYSGAYYGEENDNSQANAFLKRLDQLKHDAGIKDLFMPVHTGRQQIEGAEHARGASKVDDWADHRWILSRPEGSATRFFKAEGRGIDYGNERETQYDFLTKSVKYSAFTGTRREKEADDIDKEVLQLIKDQPGINMGDLEVALPTRKGKVGAAVKRLMNAHKVERRDGPHNSKLCYLFGDAP